MSTIVVVPWHQRSQLDKFIDAWGIEWQDSRILFQQDANREGCAVTKTKALREPFARGRKSSSCWMTIVSRRPGKRLIT